MRVCDICFLPGDVQGFSAKSPHARVKGIPISSASADDVWNTQRGEAPELCKECFTLIREKQWVAVGRKYEEALSRFVKATGYDPNAKE